MGKWRHWRIAAATVISLDSVSRPSTMYLGPQNALLTLEVQFRGTASATEVAEAIERMKVRIRARFPDFKRIYVEAESHQSAVSR